MAINQSSKAYTTTYLGSSSPDKAGFMVLPASATVPSGWQVCDGSAISRTTYSDLFTAIGTTYGVGDGSTTFNVPTLSIVIDGVTRSYLIKLYNDATTGASVGLTNIQGWLTPSLVSTTLTAQNGYNYLCNTSGGAFTATLPPGASGFTIRFSDDNRTWGTNNLTIAPATGEQIDGYGVNSTIVCDLSGAWVEFFWDGSKWVVNTSGFTPATSGNWIVQNITSATTGVAGYHYLASTSGGAFTLTLPTGVNGAAIKVTDASRTWSTNNLTIAPASGQTISNLAVNETLVCNTAGGWVELNYNGSTWVLGTTAYAATAIPNATATTPGLYVAGQAPGVASASSSFPAAGSIGEVKTMIRTTNASFPASGTWGDATGEGGTPTSITLTAGVWDIWVHTQLNIGSATFTAGQEWDTGWSTTSGNSTTGLSVAINRNFYIFQSATAANNYSTVSCRTVVRCDGTNIYLPNGTALTGTTIYWKISALYGGSAPVYGGQMTAIRIA